MKILKSLSLVLVLTVVFSSFAISSFAADAEDKVIISSIDDLPKLTNFKTGVTQIDAQQTGNVLSLSSDTFASNTLSGFSYTSAGSEARYSLISGAEKLGNVEWENYKNLRIEFNIKIANATDGISFRTQRYNDGSICLPRFQRRRKRYGTSDKQQGVFVLYQTNTKSRRFFSFDGCVAQCCN